MGDRIERAYYLVGIPKGELLQEAARLQREVSKRHCMYDEPYPVLHLTVGTVYPDNAEQLQQASCIIERALRCFAPFDIHVNGSSCFSPPSKSLNLAITEDSTLKQLAKTVQQSLESTGIPCQDMTDWDFHITLVSSIYAKREWSSEEFRQVCSLMEAQSIQLTCTVRMLELWSPTFPPLIVIDRYSLESTSHC